ncbi:MAG: hypothetical protein V4643_05385 [Bacteroidota bacterium]
MKIYFNPVDTVILFCIGSGTRFFNNGRSLKTIMMLSDCYDRSYFTTEELSICLKKLLAINFIEIKNNKIYATSTLRKKKRLICKKTNSINEEWEELEKLLNHYNDTEVLFLPKLPDDFITDESIEKAINDYVYRR